MASGARPLPPRHSGRLRQPSKSRFATGKVSALPMPGTAAAWKAEGLDPAAAGPQGPEAFCRRAVRDSTERGIAPEGSHFFKGTQQRAATPGGVMKRRPPASKKV